MEIYYRSHRKRLHLSLGLSMWLAWDLPQHVAHIDCDSYVAFSFPSAKAEPARSFECQAQTNAGLYFMKGPGLGEQLYHLRDGVGYSAERVASSHLCREPSPLRPTQTAQPSWDIMGCAQHHAWQIPGRHNHFPEDWELCFTLFHSFKHSYKNVIEIMYTFKENWNL